MTEPSKPRIAILDDYQNVALKLADWSYLQDKADISVFNDTIAAPDALVDRLRPFDALCVMRERTPLPRAILERLPDLKFIASTGGRNASIDVQAAADLGIEIANTNYFGSPTVELAWALILGLARNLVVEANAIREGRWQSTLGTGLHGKTLGILGLGHVGAEVARIGKAFGMNVIAWSQNLTDEKANAHGVTRVNKTELFGQSDFLSVHLVLSDRSRGIVDAQSLSLMKPSAFLINTSRGPIVDADALITAVTSKSIAGAAVDVYDQEPLPADSPFRHTDGILATPHIGYVSRELYQTFYRDVVDHLTRWVGCRVAT